MDVQCDFRQVPKPGSNSEQCEDSFDFSSKTSTAAVCDGASTAFESRRWARLLTKRFAIEPPHEWTRGELLDWTAWVADDWNKSIPWAKLNLFEEGKASAGSAATLVGLQLEASSERAATGTWRCLAVGDSCLFQVRGSQLVCKLPVEHSADFTSHPPLLSTDRKISAASLGKLVTDGGTWQEGDRFFLLTDAIAQWFLSQYENDRAPWELLASSPEPAFETFVHDMQADGLMHKDDVTVFMMGVGVPVGTNGRPVPIRVRPGASRDDGVVPRDEKVPALSGAGGPSGGGNTAPPRPPARPQPPAPPPTGPKPDRPKGRSAEPGRGRAKQRSRGRPGWIMAACFALGAVLGLVAGLLINSSPTPSSPTPPPVKPAAPVPPVQPAASVFAEALTSYSGGSGAAYQKYEATLQGDVAGNNPGLVPRMVGLAQAPADSVQSQGKVVSVSVASSSRSQAKLYVVVRQLLTTPCTSTTPGTSRNNAAGGVYSCPKSHTAEKQSPRFLLIDLTMIRQGQKWLVSDGQITLISSASGALSLASGANGGTP
jgi:hypothetical protein